MLEFYLIGNSNVILLIPVLQLKITHANFNKNQTDKFYSDGHWFIASQGSAYGKSNFKLNSLQSTFNDTFISISSWNVYLS